MKDNGIIHGSESSAKPLIISKTTVRVHTDIQQVEVVDEMTGETRTEWQYHEVVYDKDEYIKMMAEQNASLENQVTDTQLALCEMYEEMMMT